MNRLLQLLVLVLAGCGAPVSFSDAGCTGACDPQTPPTGNAADISAWLATGAYKGWKCEPEVHAARPPSPHGRNRVCNNTALSSTASGEYPAGAASVKELYGSGPEITGLAIGLKLEGGPSTGAKWYWFEQLGTSIAANGRGDKPGTESSSCTGCHQGAPRDFVFTQVQ